MGQAAIQLLLHLIEAVNRARRIGVVGERGAVGDLERSGLQRRDVVDALIGRVVRLSGAAAGQGRTLTCRQSGFRNLSALGRSQIRLRWASGGAREIAVLAGGTADERRRQDVVGKFLRRRGEQEGIGIGCEKLLRIVEIGTGNRVLVGIQLDDAFREEVIYAISTLRHVGGEHVIEAAIFSNDHDDVLDRGHGRGVGRFHGFGCEAALAKGAAIANWNIARVASPRRK